MENSETATMALTTTTTPPPPKTEAEPVSEAVIALEKSAAKETKVAPKKSASPTAAAAVATIAAKPRPRSEHPSAAIMVKAAIRTLHERNGSSVHAIKKYIAATYKIDSQKFAPFIKKSLKSCVISGKLVQTKGKGASGSFKLPLMAAIVGTNNQKSSTRTMPTKIKKNVEMKKKGAVGAVVKKVIVPKRIGRAPKMTKKVLEKKKQVQEEKKQEEKKEKKTMMKVAKIKTLSKGATKKAPTAGPKAPKPKKVSLLLEGKRLGRTSALLKKK